MNPKQEKFCFEYVVDFNGRQAAIRAGYSRSSAKSTAYTLLKKNEIQARVKELNEQLSAAIPINKQRVIARLAQHAFDDDNEVRDQLRALDTLLKHLDDPSGTADWEVRHVFEFPHNDRDEPV